MNQLFVCVVLLCAVVIYIYSFTKSDKRDIKNIIVPLAPHRSLPDYDVITNKYGSTRALDGLTDVEMQLNTCNQQTGLIDVEIQKLQSRLIEKNKKSVLDCQSKLKSKFGIYRRLYKNINNADMSASEISELENRVGIEKQN
jgi:hypothetical protein